MAHLIHLRHQFSVGDRGLKFYNLSKRKTQLSNNLFFYPPLHSMILGCGALIKEDNAPHWACKCKYATCPSVKNQVEQTEVTKEVNSQQKAEYHSHHSKSPMLMQSLHHKISVFATLLRCCQTKKNVSFMFSTWFSFFSWQMVSLWSTEFHCVTVKVCFQTWLSLPCELRA